MGSEWPTMLRATLERARGASHGPRVALMSGPRGPCPGRAGGSGGHRASGPAGGGGGHRASGPCGRGWWPPRVRASSGRGWRPPLWSSGTRRPSFRLPRIRVCRFTRSALWRTFGEKEERRKKSERFGDGRRGAERGGERGDAPPERLEGGEGRDEECVSRVSAGVSTAPSKREGTSVRGRGRREAIKRRLGNGRRRVERERKGRVCATGGGGEGGGV